MSEIICEKGCQNSFSLNEIKLDQFETFPGNVERHYIECPNCGQQYTSYYLDDEMKMVQQELRELQQKDLPEVKKRNKSNKLKSKLQFMAAGLMKEAQNLEDRQKGDD